MRYEHTNYIPWWVKFLKSIDEKQRNSQETIGGNVHFTVGPSQGFDSMGETTFMRAIEETDQLLPKTSPPSIANAMKALQNKIKTLEISYTQKSQMITDLQSQLKWADSTEIKKLELSYLEFKQKAVRDIEKLKRDKEEFKKVINSVKGDYRLFWIIRRW